MSISKARRPRHPPLPVTEGWLIFSEPQYRPQMDVVLKKPTLAFLRAWDTRAIPVTIKRKR